MLILVKTYLWPSRTNYKGFTWRASHGICPLLPKASCTANALQSLNGDEVKSRSLHEGDVKLEIQQVGSHKPGQQFLGFTFTILQWWDQKSSETPSTDLYPMIIIISKQVTGMMDSLQLATEI